MISTEEARSRNFVLGMKHGKLPSYAYWDENSLADELLEIKLDWWKSFLYDDSLFIKMIAKYWIQYFTNDN